MKINKSSLPLYIYIFVFLPLYNRNKEKVERDLGEISQNFWIVGHCSAKSNYKLREGGGRS